jgi:hypothetical protein
VDVAEHLLLGETIKESLDQLDEESKGRQKVFRREKEHRENLDRLGLDEIGALEYALMLSRDEALARELAHQDQDIDEGVFEGDFDDIPSAGPSHQQQQPRQGKSSQTPSPPSSSRRAYEAGVVWDQSPSARKIQVSPRHRPEPREAGWPELTPTPSPSPPKEQAGEQFPPVSTSPISVGGVARTPSSVGSGSAWNTPLRSMSRTSSRSGPSSFTGPGSGSFSQRMTMATSNGANNREEGQQEGEDDEDDDPDLKLAIELSLAEARSLNQL